MNITSTIYKTEPTQFTMTGQRLDNTLTTQPTLISAGLVKRLHRYALGSMAEVGFDAVIQGWNVNVYTMDADEKVTDRYYSVRFINPQQGYIQVSGIMLNAQGWPTLDHGFDIGKD